MTGREVAFLVPEGIDDPDRVSGGNVYDRYVRDGLSARGRRVATVLVTDAAGVASALGDLPGGATVLLDGLVALWAPREVVAAAGRLRIVVLAHMVAAAFPDAAAATASGERQVLAAAHRVIVTSPWTAAELGRRGLVAPERVTVAVPGVDRGRVDRGRVDRGRVDGGRADGGRAGLGSGEEPADAGKLLCVGVVAPHKGQDTLLAALSRLPERDWVCTIAGSTDTFPDFASSIARDARQFAGRVRLAGVLGKAALTAEYRCGALLVAPSRVESCGMAIAEARGHGMPVVAASVGGIPDTVAGGGAILVPPDDPAALAAAIDGWMSDLALRQRLRAEVHTAQAGLPTWTATVTAVERALEAP